MTQGLPYDFGSCMQFAFDAYSKNNLPTILPKYTSVPMEVMGDYVWPSEQDYLDINLSYCGEITVLQAVTLHTPSHCTDCIMHTCIMVQNKFVTVDGEL